MWNEICHQALIAVGVLSETLDQYFWSSGAHCGAPDVIPASMVELRQCSTTSWVTAMPKPQWELLHLLVWADALRSVNLSEPCAGPRPLWETHGNISYRTNTTIYVYSLIYWFKMIQMDSKGQVSASSPNFIKFWHMHPDSIDVWTSRCNYSIILKIQKGCSLVEKLYTRIIKRAKVQQREPTVLMMDNSNVRSAVT